MREDVQETLPKTNQGDCNDRYRCSRFQSGSRGQYSQSGHRQEEEKAPAGLRHRPGWNDPCSLWRSAKDSPHSAWKAQSPHNPGPQYYGVGQGLTDKTRLLRQSRLFIDFAWYFWYILPRSDIRILSCLTKVWKHKRADRICEFVTSDGQRVF